MTYRSVNCPKCGGIVHIEEDAMFGHCLFCDSRMMVFIEGIGNSVKYDPMKESFPKCEDLFNINDFDALENYCDEVLRDVDFDHICRFYKGVCLLIKEERTEAYDIWTEIFRECTDEELCKFIYKNICIQIVNIVFSYVFNHATYEDVKVFGALDYLERSMKDCDGLDYESGDFYRRICDLLMNKGRIKTTYVGCLAILRMFKSVTDNVIFGRMEFDRAVEVLRYIMDAEKVFSIRIQAYHVAVKTISHLKNNEVPTRWGNLSYDDSCTYLKIGEGINQNVCDLYTSELMFMDHLLTGLTKIGDAYKSKGISLHSLNRDDFGESSHFNAYSKAHKKVNMSFSDNNPRTSLVIECSMKMHLNEYLSWYDDAFEPLHSEGNKKELKRLLLFKHRNKGNEV